MTAKPENKCNFNFDSNWNLPIDAWNMIFKNKVIIRKTDRNCRNLAILTYIMPIWETFKERSHLNMSLMCVRRNGMALELFQDRK